MEKQLPWPHYESSAKQFLEKKLVRDIEFARATYQVEVFDPELGESYWPFLQFDLHGELKDSFCSCESEEEGCVHLACAYLRIFGTSPIPLHIRFEKSFFYALGLCFADHIGYEEVGLEKVAEDHYRTQNGVAFEIKGEGIDPILLERVKETPETSIKFSNFSQKEILWWKEGRPSERLRYQLSYWFDLAKWMMLQEEEAPGKVTFTEDAEGLPSSFSIEWKKGRIQATVTHRDLLRLIPSLGTLDCPLRVSKDVGGKVTSIHYDEARQQMQIEHAKESDAPPKGESHALNGWIYRSGQGFYAKKGEGFFTGNTLPKERIEEALDEHAEELEELLDNASIFEDEIPVHYTMRFDEDWNWRFSAYLREPGDLKRGFFGSWAFVPGEGFYPLKGVLFPTADAIVSPSDVSQFVNHHRIWLNTQEGYQTHLASVESQLVFTIDEKGLHFQAKSYGAEDQKNAHDFGDWIYYAGQGFFSKEHAKIGQVVRPGLDIPRDKVSSFIKVNREELDSIPGFFTTQPAITERSLEVRALSENAIEVRPVWKSTKSDEVQFFGDFAYTKAQGFYELPALMRLPDIFNSTRQLEGKELQHFFSEEFPHYEKYFSKIDPKLKRPHKTDIGVSYLVRTQEGLKAELELVTEHGKLNLLDIQDAFEKKYAYLFSEAGLIDLSDDSFAWMKGLKRTGEESSTVDLSTLDFLRLEATATLLEPTDLNPQADITRMLLKELREFAVKESPNLKGLQSELRQYQQTGLNWLWFLYRNGLSALLCDDMGLGKTHQSMALMAAILNQRDFKEGRFLVVCPTSVIYHWQDKMERFLPHIKVHTFHGLRRSLSKLPKEGLILTSYGTFRMEKEQLKKIRFELAVFDEIQVAKNPSSQIHDALATVNARTSVGLTGTPIENNLRELKALFDIVLPGYMPGEAQFRKRFVVPIERDLDEEKKAQLTALIRPFILRRRKSEVLDELPEKSEDKLHCELSEDQIALYKQALDQRREALIADLRDRDTAIPFIHIFSILTQLKQVCNHPALVHKAHDQFKQYQSGKWDLFVELLEEACQGGQKVVVFSQYLGMLDIMEAFLREKGYGYAQIRGSTVNRKEELKRFQEDPKCMVFIGSLQAAGLGIDLTAASIVIMYDRWWNAARENQAIDRVHRMGQKWAVQVYKLISKGTIEEKIDRMITKKGQLMEDIVTTEDQAVLKKLSRSELIELLSFTPTD